MKLLAATANYYGAGRPVSLEFVLPLRAAAPFALAQDARAVWALRGALVYDQAGRPVSKLTGACGARIKFDRAGNAINQRELVLMYGVLEDPTLVTRGI